MYLLLHDLCGGYGRRLFVVASFAGQLLRFHFGRNRLFGNVHFGQGRSFARRRRRLGGGLLLMIGRRRGYAGHGYADRPRFAGRRHGPGPRLLRGPGHGLAHGARRPAARAAVGSHLAGFRAFKKNQQHTTAVIVVVFEER